MFSTSRVASLPVRKILKCVRYVSSTVPGESGVSEVEVTRKFLPLAEPTSVDHVSPSSTRISVSEALRAIEERQEQRKKSGIFAIEGTRCKHGFPRAFVQLPIHNVRERTDHRPSMQYKKTAVQSGMIRLSCPHLTKAIDQFEYEGTGIKKLNSDLNEPDSSFGLDLEEPMLQDQSVERTHDNQPKVVTQAYSASTQELRKHYTQIHSHWRELKNALITDEQRVKLVEQLGEKEAEHFLNTGIGGAGHVNDVKCLHLHTADALLRGKEANKFGAWTLDQLEKERGVDVNGCDDCWQQCDRNFKRTETSWWYTSVKNKMKLYENHKQRRVEKNKAADRKQRETQAAQDQEARGGLQDATFPTKL